MINVIAREGLKVPREDHARRYITDRVAVAVDAHSAYYQRRLRDGDLLPAAPVTANPATIPRKKEGR